MKTITYSHLVLGGLFAIAISGCGFHKKPYVMYEGNHPLSTTTVFSSADLTRTKLLDARIIQVDGKETSCFQVGCPYWVRLMPGNHSFVISYKADFQMGGGFITHKEARLTVDVNDMKPSHIYEARYTESGGRVYARVIDIGERPNYGLKLGLEGVNQRYYPVSFD